MLTCNIVKDLFPNYIDGLVSEETAQEIAEHLTGCADCRTAYAQMKTPVEPIIEQDRKEIDYLKKIRAKTKSHVLKYSVICTSVVVVLVVAFMFIIARGTPVKSTDLNYVASIAEAQTVRVELSPSNGLAFSLQTKVTYNEATGQMTEFIISPRQVPKWFPNGNAVHYGYEYTPDSGLSEDFQIVIRLSDKDIILTADDLENN